MFSNLLDLIVPPRRRRRQQRAQIETDLGKYVDPKRVERLLNPDARRLREHDVVRVIRVSTPAADCQAFVRAPTAGAGAAYRGDRERHR